MTNEKKQNKEVLKNATAIAKVYEMPDEVFVNIKKFVLEECDGNVLEVATAVCEICYIKEAFGIWCEYDAIKIHLKNLWDL